MSNHHGHDERQNSGGFEQQDLGSRPVYGFLISLVVVGVLLYYVLWRPDALALRPTRCPCSRLAGADGTEQDTAEVLTPVGKTARGGTGRCCSAPRCSAGISRAAA